MLYFKCFKFLKTKILYLPHQMANGFEMPFSDCEGDFLLCIRFFALRSISSFKVSYYKFDHCKQNCFVCCFYFTDLPLHSHNSYYFRFLPFTFYSCRQVNGFLFLPPLLKKSSSTLKSG